MGNLGDEIIRLWIVSQHWRLDSRKEKKLSPYLPGRKKRKTRVSQAVTKDLSSSSKFSGSCVLTLQTPPKRKVSVLMASERIHFQAYIYCSKQEICGSKRRKHVM